jgi:ABC-type lipoprotein release transport system permease subunit
MTIEMDNSISYVTLSAAQQFIDMPDGYSGILITVSGNKNHLEAVLHNIEQVVDTDMLDVLPWQFTMEDLLRTSESNRAFLILLMGILYVIVGFGIFGTVVMMTNERIREFCVMISLGMSRVRLAWLVCVELFIKSLFGALLAVIITIPVTIWFNQNPIQMWGEVAETFSQFGMEPIIPMAAEASIFIDQIITILVISMIAVIYPIRKILRLNLSKNK